MCSYCGWVFMSSQSPLIENMQEEGQCSLHSWTLYSSREVSSQCTGKSAPKSDFRMNKSPGFAVRPATQFGSSPVQGYRNQSLEQTLVPPLHCHPHWKKFCNPQLLFLYFAQPGWVVGTGVPMELQCLQVLAHCASGGTALLSTLFLLLQPEWVMHTTWKQHDNIKIHFNYLYHVSLTGRIVCNDELERMQRQAWPILRYYSSIFMEGLRKNSNLRLTRLQAKN